MLSLPEYVKIPLIMKGTVKPRRGPFYTYIVRCRDGTYYTGYTNDLERRVGEHNGKVRGARYTRGKGPVRVVWYKEYKFLKKAMQKEIEIKRLRRNQKEELIYGKRR